MQMVNITIWCRRSAPEYTSRQDIVASALLELNWLSKMCQIPHRTACLTQLTAVALNAVRKIARHSHSALQNGRRNSAQGRTPQDRHVGGDGREGGAANERRWLDRPTPFRVIHQIMLQKISFPTFKFSSLRLSNYGDE